MNHSSEAALTLNRTFDVSAGVDNANPQGATQLWLPIPLVNSDWQQSLQNSFSSNGRAKLAGEHGLGRSTALLFLPIATAIGKAPCIPSRSAPPHSRQSYAEHP
ncbi:MAG: hypothetical protein KJ614_16165 [Gammaproteobacteria bacterium]|uniref:hypothetical protein n=1 Tax=Rhodoferax sp. TaxID=50421 RepID=UPI00179BD4F1|nr:hypothetical protein [Rhodoferax sp.]MBU3900428.1 hypothetical protein [Gammaproteobacteria bacterium]MBA3059659.1 hypothetical protein [Rhodoferax sp.]MBU3997395.1 hypothetical protein [Gammaproteobacteria bacterium]MBU4082316.1 hypothetical protein [Gammaproteobacteria bacterium]MBU4112879.1 hypothetical protein [Gammaproteobacteria bacterium]